MFHNQSKMKNIVLKFNNVHMTMFYHASAQATGALVFVTPEAMLPLANPLQLPCEELT